MPIEDVFTIKGRGTVVTGRVQTGTLKKGDKIAISGKNRATITTHVSAMEGFIRDPDSYVASPGDNCAVLLREIEADQLEIGMIITNAASDC
ncbi:MAG: EF-Tu/IF-2/RF-3 family GTPase [Chloroflexota bacterium]